MIGLYLSLLGSIFWLACAQAAVRPQCVDLSGRYRFDSVVGSCRRQSNEQASSRSTGPAPARDGLVLIPETLVPDGILIPEHSSFELQQTGCGELKITYDESVVNVATQGRETRTVVRDIALLAEGRAAESFRWSKGRATATIRQAAGVRDGEGPGVVHYHETWSLALGTSRDLVLRSTKRNWSVVALEPETYRETLACRLTRVTP